MEKMSWRIGRMQSFQTNEGEHRENHFHGNNVRLLDAAYTDCAWRMEHTYRHLVELTLCSFKATSANIKHTRYLLRLRLEWCFEFRWKSCSCALCHHLRILQIVWFVCLWDTERESEKWCSWENRAVKVWQQWNDTQLKHVLLHQQVIQENCYNGFWVNVERIVWRGNREMNRSKAKMGMNRRQAYETMISSFTKHIRFRLGPLKPHLQRNNSKKNATKRKQLLCL